jgi:sec-independent protein translocase protein TatA
MFGNLGYGEMLLIVLVIILLFGGKKIPELARGLGRGIREFKEGMKEASETKPELKDKNENPDKNQPSN